MQPIKRVNILVVHGKNVSPQKLEIPPGTGLPAQDLGILKHSIKTKYSNSPCIHLTLTDRRPSLEKHKIPDVILQRPPSFPVPNNFM